MLDGYKIKFNVSVSYITSYFIVADNQNYQGEMLYKLILRCLKAICGDFKTQDYRKYFYMYTYQLNML